MLRTSSSRRLVPALVAGALLATIAACSDSATPAATPDLGAAPNGGGIWAGNVTVQATAAGLQIGNNTTRPIGYAVFARDILPVITWRPCTQRSGCPTVAPGERRVVPTADIPGMESGKGAVEFYWWHLVEGRDGQLEPDSVRSTQATF